MKTKVGFICVHNSCRSQMAEAISKLIAKDVFEAYSAGTATKPEINQDAVRIMKELYGVDMNETQESKTTEAIPNLDIVITMGCEVDCPWLESKHREDWGLEDPSGKEDQYFIETAQTIHKNIEDLMLRIQNKEIKI